MNKPEVAVRGESMAAQLLEKKGYKILAKNFTTRIGEIDIIAQEGDTIVFVEVKARSSFAFGHPIEAVTPYKVQKIALVSQEYLNRTHKTNSNVRFDVIECFDREIKHTKNAFSLNDAKILR